MKGVLVIKPLEPAKTTKTPSTTVLYSGKKINIFQATAVFRGSAYLDAVYVYMSVQIFRIRVYTVRNSVLSVSSSYRLI